MEFHPLEGDNFIVYNKLDAWEIARLSAPFGYAFFFLRPEVPGFAKPAVIWAAPTP